MNRQLPSFMRSPGRGQGHQNRNSPQRQSYGGRNRFRSTPSKYQQGQRRSGNIPIITFSIIEMEPDTRIGVKISPPKSEILKIIKVW